MRKKVTKNLNHPEKSDLGFSRVGFFSKQVFFLLNVKSALDTGEYFYQTFITLLLSFIIME